MKCDAAQNRLLALPDPGRPPDALRDHLAGCGDCRRFREQAAVLDARLAALPAPASEERKLAFIESLLSAGPVITAVPAPPTRGSRSLREVLAGFAWKPAGSVAAVALVGLFGWRMWPAPKPLLAELPGPRAELVAKVLEHQRELVRTTDTAERLARLTALAGDLEAEAKAVGLAAGTDEMRAVADMYERVVAGGVLEQARRTDRLPAGEKVRVLNAAVTQLGTAAADLRAVPATPAARPSFDKMARTAEDARTALLQLLRGV